MVTTSMMRSQNPNAAPMIQGTWFSSLTRNPVEGAGTVDRVSRRSPIHSAGRWRLHGGSQRNSRFRRRYWARWLAVIASIAFIDFVIIIARTKRPASGSEEGEDACRVFRLPNKPLDMIQVNVKTVNQPTNEGEFESKWESIQTTEVTRNNHLSKVFTRSHSRHPLNWIRTRRPSWRRSWACGRRACAC